MQFVDKCLSEDAIYTIENIVQFHISGNFEDVRNTILGYDSKNKIWKSSYGEYVAKRYVSDIRSPTMSPLYILNRRSNNRYDNKTNNNINDDTEKDKTIDIFGTHDGMTFYEDDIYEYVRIYIDDSIKRVLDVLFTISKNVIDYRHIIDTIITEWNVKNVINTISLHSTYVDHGICGDLHYYKLEINQSSWRDLKKITKHRGLTIRDTFKDAVIIFLENRSEILKENVI